MKKDFYGDVYIGSKKVDSIFIRSMIGKTKKERQINATYELLTGPDFYELAWKKNANGLYDIKKGFRVRETTRNLRRNSTKLTDDERWHLLKQSRDSYVRRAMKGGKIPLRTAKAMVRAGLPLSRSDLRGNPLGVRTTTKDERKIPRKFPLYYTGPAPRMPLVYLYDDLTRLMKNRDELLMDFDIRERPGHPYDFIIIAKFRSYVSGARLYSAGLKTKSRIENTLAGFGRLIGYRSKRIGNSDYSYEIFAIRLDKELHKPQSGKLFDNAKSFPNIEKSGFHKGEYVGYSPKAVNFFSITKSRLVGWKAMGEIYKTNPPRKVWKILYAKNLSEMSKLLENL